MKEIEISLKKILEKRVDVAPWMLIFLSFIFLRSFVEQFLAETKTITMLETIIEFMHNLYFFSLAILMLWLFLSFILKVKPQKLSYFLIFSLFLAIAPSIIDMLKTHGQIYWSFYLLSSPRELLSQYLSVFGHLPSGIVYFGTKITFILTVFLLAIFVYLMTKNWLKAIFTAIASYSILFFMGSFPSLFYYVYTFVTRDGRVSDIHSFDIAGFFGAPEKIWGVVFPSFQYTLAYKLNYIYFIFLVFLLLVIFWSISREKFLAVLKNSRLIQMIYHEGIFFIGMGLGYLQYRNNFYLDLFSFLAVSILLISIYLSWMASVVVNDLFDYKIDQISNQGRPLPKKIFTASEYSQFGVACFLLAILGGLTIGLPFAVVLIIYQLLAWLYSAVPFRLKKFPLIATFVSSLASLMVLFLGYILVSDNQSIRGLSWRITSLLLIAYTISLPIKDFKDIAGDKEDDVWTVPVIFGEKKGRLIVAVGVFLSYAFSVFFLNELKLFPWAMFFGASTFIIINNSEIKANKLPAWVLGLVSAYTLILIKIVFIR